MQSFPKFAPEVVFCVAVSVWVSVVWGLSEVRQDSETHSALWVRWCVMWGAVVPLIALVLGSVACMQGRVAQFLSHPGLVLLGNASFALYLMHWLPLGVLLNIFGPQSMSWFQITFISALLVLGSIVIYLGFEAPIRRWVLVKFS